MTRLIMVVLVFCVAFTTCLVCPTSAAQDNCLSSQQYGHDRTDFIVDGYHGFVILPSDKDDLISWVWYAPTFKGTMPCEQHEWICSRLLARGIAVCGVDVADSHGSPQARAAFTKFHKFVVSKFRLTEKAGMWAQSRGGLMLLNWAVEHPKLVKCFGGTYPVCDLTSYPGLDTTASAYGMTVDQLQSQLPQNNPIDRLAPLAAHKVPVFLMHGDTDVVVPLEQNSAEIARRYKKLGGPVELKIIHGVGHESIPEFFESQDMVDFFVRQMATREKSDSPTACRVTLDTVGESYVVSGPAFRVTVDRATGLPNRVESLWPSPMSLWNGKNRSIVLTVEDRDRTWEKTFNIPSRIRKWTGKDEVGAFAAVESQLKANGVDWSAKLTVRVYDDRLCIDGDVKFDKAVSEPLIIRLSQPYDASLWNRHLFYEPQGRVRILSPTATALRQYGYDPTDRATDDFAPQEWKWVAGQTNPRDVEGWPLDNLGYPRGILEASDRYLLYGKLELGEFATFAVNWDETGPCMLRMPKVIRAGDIVRFSLTYRAFAKPDNTLFDVCRWYSENIYSTSPLSKEIVTLKPEPEPRHLIHQGNVVTGACDYLYDCDLIHKLELVQIMGIKPKTDELPQLGSPEDIALLEATKKLQGAGLRGYQYFRQAAFANMYHDDRPRYMRWLLNPRENMVWNWGTGGDSINGIVSIGIIDWNAKKDVLNMDLCNPEAVDWYIKDLKRYIDVHQPDGIQWDMGWDLYIGPCIKHPDVGVHHGTLRIQREIYEYIRQKHPHMRVIQNESLGSPSMLYCDLVMSEEGVDISPEMLANVEHYRVSLMGLYYVWTYQQRYGENWEARYIHDVMRNLSWGFTWGIGNFSEILDKPNITALTEIADFSAVANCLPRVIEREALECRGDDRTTTGRVWANRERMLVAIFNDSDKQVNLDALVNLRMLEGKHYGYRGRDLPEIKVLSDKGRPVASDMRADYREDCLQITGTLGRRQLVLLAAQ